MSKKKSYPTKKPAKKAKRKNIAKVKAPTPALPTLPAVPKKVKKEKNVGGRPATGDPGDAAIRQRERAAVWREKATRKARDIAEGFDASSIDWIERLRSKDDPEYFAYRYLPRVFYLPPSADHLRIVAKARRVFQEAGKFSLAMPRGQGKTAWCRALIIWGTAFAYKRFPFFVGSTQPKATQTLDFIKTYWYTSTLLRQDFPEIAYPIHCLENRHHLAKGQLFLDRPTHVEWGNESIQYPCLLLPPEIAAPYLEEDPDSLMRDRKGKHIRVALDGGSECDSDALYLPASAGTIIRTAGIDGSIRGEAEVHPVTLEQPRPDLVLLDDIAKDAKAESPAACEKLERLIDGAIDGLAGPDEALAVLMPCTVTREGDISDIYLDRTKKPEYAGERCSMVQKWPDGLSDYETDLDKPAGKLWNKYGELRRKSLQRHEHIRLATNYYVVNREEMDSGFIVSWEHRFNASARYGGLQEVSAIQHAMNLRCASPWTFPAEYQNKPKNQDQGSVLITPAQLRERIVGIKRGTVPGYATKLVAFIDVQNESMYYLILAVANDFTGVIVDYGTFPESGSKYYRRSQFDSWSLLTRDFFDEYPQLREQATKTEGGKLRAPFEAKIYHGVKRTVSLLMARSFPRGDIEGTDMTISRIGIDARWGRATDAIKKYVNNQRDTRILPVFGTGITPAHKQYEEYSLTKGWLFEHQLHPGLQECKWVWRPGPDGYYYLATDVNRLKTFAFSRLSSPLGMPGAITLFEDTPENHELVSDQIAGSQFPILTAQRGRSKEMWEKRDGGAEDEFLDCLVGCIALASMEGIRIVESADNPQPTRQKPKLLSQLWKEKKALR